METWQKFVACLHREDPLYSQGKTAKVSFYVLSKSQSSFFPTILTFSVLGPRRALTHFFSSINYDRWYFIMHLKKKLAVGLPFKVWRKFENLPTTQCLHATVCSVKPLGWHELISVIQFPESDSLIEMILLLGACLWNAINFVCQGVKRFYRKERLSKDGYPCSGNRRNKTPSALNSISFLSTCTVFAWMRNQYRDMILLIL